MAENFRARLASDFREIFTYINRVGGQSLISLALGCSVLILFALNVLKSDDDPLQSRNTSQVRIRPGPIPFKVGSQQGVQFWLAVLGAGFGMFSYGLSESNNHLFDLWATRKAGSRPGLDYARYLNTQPRAPVWFGMRGFLSFVSVRQIVAISGIIASVAYKFAVKEVVWYTAMHLDKSAIDLRFPSPDGLFPDGETSPWLGDGLVNESPRAFIHRYSGSGGMLPPSQVVMTGRADCGDTFHINDEGTLKTLEVVMVANLARSNTQLETVEIQRPESWARIVRDSPGWLGTSLGDVLDYKTGDGGTLNFRWASREDMMGSQATSSLRSQAMIRTATYDVFLALVEISRVVSSKQCWTFEKTWDDDHSAYGPAIWLIYPDTAKIAQKYLRDPEEKPPNQPLLEYVVRDSKTTLAEGFSAIIRHKMAGWGRQLSQDRPDRLGHAGLLTNNTPSLFSSPITFPKQGYGNTFRDGWKAESNGMRHGSWGHSEWHQDPRRYGGRNSWELYALKTDEPNLPQGTTAYRWARSEGDSKPVEYPVYTGTRVTNKTGSYDEAAFTFIALGVLGLVLVVVRVFLGPAQLTSWMGQHVHLALEGMIQKDGAQRLASGHRAAEKLGVLKMKRVKLLLSGATNGLDASDGSADQQSPT